MVERSKVNVGITGGAGFIGSNLARRLSISGHEITILDNLSSGLEKNLDGVKHFFCKVDLTDSHSVEDLFSKRDFHYLFHLGALGSVPRSLKNPRSSFENNALATLNVLEYARKSETPVFFSSSSSVYGKNTKLPKIETDWLSPISPYAASKLSAEALCQAYAESFGLKISVLRLFNVYGPAQNPENVYAAVIPKWIRSAMKGDPIEVYGDGEQKRDFTFVDDVTSVMEDIMNKIDISIPPTNLAYGQSVSLNHILDIFKEYYGDIEVKYSAYRKGDIRDSESDTTKMMELKVGPSSPTAIKDGLLKTFKWFAKRQ